MAGGRLDFEFHLAKTGSSRRRPSAGRPMRILVLADLGGSVERALPLSARSPLSINVDNAEHVMALIAPRLTLNLGAMTGAEEDMELEFRQMDDFHPDALFRHADAFASLRRWREELANPASFVRAAAALGMSAATASDAITPAMAESDAEVVERLLGRRPAQDASHDPAVVDRLLKAAVASHIVQDHSVAQAQALAALDATIAERMRRILRQPAFQRLEAAWRGVWKLATELETGDALQVSVLDISREELETDLRSHAEDLSAANLCRILLGPETQGEEGGKWSLLLGDFFFGPDAREVSALAAMGALAARAGAPFLAAASPRLVGCTNPQELARTPSVGEAEPRWHAFRQSPSAEWVGLAMPRLLARLPYGAKNDPIESFAFEEMADGREHGCYLWGNPAYALAFLAGQAFSEEGWDMDLGTRLEIEDLPSYIYRDEDGEAKQQPCAEVWLSESTAEAMLDWGVMPVISYRNRNAARLLRWQSLSFPARGLAGLASV